MNRSLGQGALQSPEREFGGQRLRGLGGSKAPPETHRDRAIPAYSAANLRKLREAKGISIHELAALAELEYGQLQKTETGQVNPTLFTIIRIAQGLNITPDTLLKY